ncbi:hypothetical protein [Falsiroseomonas sp. HW251]|uniref:hypothetical protein n=1 Tax=Falsiroseomonas sp. HW251 TaxID=3390998 RepID=UPI003D31AC34
MFQRADEQHRVATLNGYLAVPPNNVILPVGKGVRLLFNHPTASDARSERQVARQPGSEVRTGATFLARVNSLSGISGGAGQPTAMRERDDLCHRLRLCQRGDVRLPPDERI